MIFPNTFSGRMTFTVQRPAFCLPGHAIKWYINPYMYVYGEITSASADGQYDAEIRGVKYLDYWEWFWESA